MRKKFCASGARKPFFAAGFRWERSIFFIISFFMRLPRKSADNGNMKIGAMMPVVLGVLKNPIVIISSVAIILYLNFVFFVARYVKKPPRPKRKKVAAPPPPKAAEEKKEGADEGKEDAGGAD